MASIPTHYSPNGSLAEYQRFTADYFSGCNVGLFFGDVMIDEIVAIEFQIQEQMLPIYGYASYTYDTICHGSRLVSGTFKINFVESGYLMSVMNTLWNEKASETNSLFTGNLKDDIAITPQALSSKDFITQKQNIPWDNLDDYVSAYETYIWGDTPKTGVIAPGHDSQYFNRKNSVNDIKFDILIHYSPGMLAPIGTDSNAIYTIESLNDVHIFGCSKIIDPSGQPIQEVYQFMANDWNNKIEKTTYK